MTFDNPSQYYLKVIINVVAHGCPSQLSTISGDYILEEFSSLKPTREPHRVDINFHLYLGRCIHTVNVITLYETAKDFIIFLSLYVTFFLGTRNPEDPGQLG